MKHYLLLASALILISCTQTNPTSETSTEVNVVSQMQTSDAIRRIITEHAESGSVTGLSVGISKPGQADTLVYSGFAKLDPQIDVNAETQFRIASITKPFTAALILQRIEEGDFSLDTTIDRWFPDLYRADAVTVRDLLAHTSGLPMFGDLDQMLATETSALYLFEPGTMHAYSNAGYYLLGNILQRESGLSYAELLETEIFEPFGMKGTTYETEDADRTLWAQGYSIDEDAPAGFSPGMEIGPPFSAGGLRSTISDMLVFTQALYGGELLSPETVSHMSQPASVRDGRLVGEARYIPPEWGTPPEPPEGWTDDHYGLGLSLTTMYGEKVYWHSGGVPSFNAIWAHIPNLETTVIMMSNTDNGSVPIFEPVMRALIDTE